MARLEICLAGHGGQGLVLAGKILAEALALYGNKNTVQTQSYGPEARGGASRSEIIVSDDEIDYPKVTQPDILLALTQEAIKRYLPNLKPGGTLVIDPFRVKEEIKGDFKIYSIAITHLAKAELGKIIFGNIIALGALAALTGLIPRDQLAKGVLKYVPESTRDLNKKALEIGYQAGAEALKIGK